MPYYENSTNYRIFLQNHGNIMFTVSHEYSVS